MKMVGLGNLGRHTPPFGARASMSLLLVVLLHACFVRAGENANAYADGEQVRVYAGQIGPSSNAFETYSFFRAPGCPPASSGKTSSTLGQILAGRQLREMTMSVQFGKNVDEGVVCTFTPKEADIKRLNKMIRKKYVYQLFIDELPVSAMLGNVGPEGAAVYLHRAFRIEVNKNQIVGVTMETTKETLLAPAVEYTFTYSVRFVASQLPFAQRFDKYVDRELFDPRPRWISIVNSILLLLLLVVVITSVVLRAIHADFKGEQDELGIDDNHGLVEGSGWKQLCADVHRVPPHPLALCALLGTGAQLLFVFVVMILSAAYYGSRHKHTYGAVTMVTEVYALTGLIAGYVSASKFLRYTVYNPALARRWIHCMFFTMFAFPAAILSCGVATNAIAYLYGSARALHLGGAAYVTLLLLFVFCPAVVVGTLTGRYVHWRQKDGVGVRNNVLHVNQIPRLVPKPPYRLLSRPYLILLTGILPFGSITLELSLVFSCLWLDKLYYTYFFLLTTFTIFLFTASCASVFTTYVLLNMEDHRWQWMAFGFGASTGFFVYLHATYFYFFYTSMSGVFIFVFYFAYSALFSLSIGLTGGCVAFFASSLFVQKIYASVKLD